MTTHTQTTAPFHRFEAAQEDLLRWGRIVDRLLNAFEGSRRTTPGLASKLEELRHRRETAAVKAQALLIHRDEGLARAGHEFDLAKHELHTAWRSVMNTVERDGAFRATQQRNHPSRS